VTCIEEGDGVREGAMPNHPTETITDSTYADVGSWSVS